MDWFALGAGVLLTAGTAVFVAAEFSLVTLDPALVESHHTDRRSGIVRRSLKRLSTELSSAQVGITVTTILLGYISQPALSRMLGSLISDWQVAQTLAVTIAATLSLVIINVFSMLFGELVPKNYALATPWTVARIAVPLQRIFTITFRPLIAVLDGSANAILRRSGIEPKEELSGARTAPELMSLVKRSAQLGTLEHGTARLLTNSIELDELTAVDVMTDRTRMAIVEAAATAQDVVVAARATGHSRFPVIGQSRDDIVGLVQVRKALAVPRDRRDKVPVTAVMDDAPQVPETVPLRSLLVNLRDTGTQMAVVVDEYGGTSGVVTLEDVVEELVGEVADEHDPRRLGVLRTTDGSWLVPGVLRPDELLERANLRVPESGSYETLGGFVMAELERIPQVGDTLEVAADNGTTLRIRVETMSGRRVVQLRIRDITPAHDAPGVDVR
ncbi:Hemolysin, contains CBS domains [Micrococcales bacterium KH10]|nr:Hemolysin, contains CBS domains [Micrococcales bacterium KH10]